MIEPGHRHHMVPVARTPLANGTVKIQSRCQSSPVANWADGCTLEQEVFVYEGRVMGVRIRFQGVWFSPLDLIRAGQGLDVAECPGCQGAPRLIDCETCHGLGLVATDGGQVAIPDLTGH